MNALLGFRVDPADVRSDDVTHDVEVVGGEVDHHAHVADARRERSLAPSVHLEHAAELAGGDSPLQLAHGRIEPFDVAHGQQAPGSRRGLDQRASLLERRGDRLLDEEMQPALENGKAHLQVEARRDRHHDGLQLLAFEHLLPRAVTTHGVRARRRRDNGRVLVGNRDQAGVLDLAEDAKVVPAHRAEADEGDARHAVDTADRTDSMIRSRSPPVRPG